MVRVANGEMEPRDTAAMGKYEIIGKRASCTTDASPAPAPPPPPAVHATDLRDKQPNMHLYINKNAYVVKLLRILYITRKIKVIIILNFEKLKALL